MKVHSKNKPCYAGTEVTRLLVLFTWSFLTRSQQSPHTASFVSHVPAQEYLEQLYHVLLG